MKREIVTCSEMKALEKAADRAGLSYYQMMENAGTRAFELLLQYQPHMKEVLIFCGKGNNGGDGFVVARKLLEEGIKTQIILVEGAPVTTDAVTNYQLIQDRIKFISADDVFDIGSPDTIIDAIYGTGFHGQLRNPADRMISLINRSDAYITALDIPSGLSGDMTSKEEVGNCVHADLTIAFHAEKPVHQSIVAKVFLGEVITADIGI